MGNQAISGTTAAVGVAYSARGRRRGLRESLKPGEHQIGTLIPAWVERAACGGQGRREGDPFFPTFPPGNHNQFVLDALWNKARAICASCPVLEDCREEYWDVPSLTVGMWYGMTPTQRETYRRNRRRWKRHHEVMKRTSP